MGIDKDIKRIEKYVENLIHDYVDPKEAFLGPDGEYWNPISGGTKGAGFGLIEQPPYRTTPELMWMRVIGKFLYYYNGYAINGYQSRVNYIIGKGHTYNAELRDSAGDPGAPIRVNAWLEKWLRKNKWKRRQGETQLRGDRDGEGFLRFFYPDDGYMLVRYVEPAAIVEPPTGEQTADYDDSFGIRTHKDDIETPIAYWVQSPDGIYGDWVPADQIQHRKCNADSSLKRGVPLFWGIRHSLDRSYDILKNNSLAIKIQSAIALIRKHQSSKEAVRSFITAKQQDSLNQIGFKGGKGGKFGKGGENDNVFRYPAGSILDSSGNISYEFPTIGADPAKSVVALQAELRHIAVAIQMPEYMFTGDASNNNRASSDTAESPAMKRFQRDQECTVEADLEIIDMAQEHAVATGILDEADVLACRVTAEAPECETRSRLDDARIRQIDMGLKILSPQTAASQTGNNYEQEQSNIESHADRVGDINGLSESELSSGLFS